MVLICLCLTGFAAATTYAPDPASVQREGPAYRYPQAGWIVVHVEGKPYERGRQQGKLLAKEIENYVKCMAVHYSSKSPSEGWALLRTMSNAMFTRRFDPELLEEMKGIADGAADGGATFDGRPLDLTDIVAINIWAELMTLDDALHAQPNGLEGKVFDKITSSAKTAWKLDRCSAFAATGPATKDGKAIIGHITMFDLYSCDFFNVWLDVKPEKGHRLVLQGAPGSVQSGMDWYINDAGMVLTETTISQTRYDGNGSSLGSRSRMAMQYGDSIESVVKILGDGGNGLYTNEWLLADGKTNEIALFELGTHTSRLMRSSKNEWYGGTEGFYWGNNNTKDLQVRLETLPGTNDRPADMTFCPEPRDREWIRLYQQNKGNIDENFGKLAFGKPPLATSSSCDAKYTTAEMATRMTSFAHWGDPYGKLWDATRDTLEKYPDATPIVPNDWTVMTPAAPAQAAANAIVAVDLKGGSSEGGGDDSPDAANTPAWHGTILPASDADVWLTTAFAGFDDLVVREKQMLREHHKDDAATPPGKAASPQQSAQPSTQPVEGSADSELSDDERDKLAVERFRFRSQAMTDGMSMQSVTLQDIKSTPADDAWYLSASGRGVMLLGELRTRMGGEKFDAAMDAFGRAHAGQPVNSKTFITAMTASGDDLNEMLSGWISKTDVLPTLELSNTTVKKDEDSGFVVDGKIISHGGISPSGVEVTIETENGETTKFVKFQNGAAKLHLTSDEKPLRIVANKYGKTACTNGWNWNGSSFKRDLNHTLIVYGTRAESDGNRIAADKLQQAIIDQWEHMVVPIKADTDVTEDDIRGHHILLVGRPECSQLVERFASSLPVTFGPRSFVVRGQTYASPGSAVIAATANPQDARFSLICIAGLSPDATLRAAKALPDSAPAPLKIFAAGKGKDIVPAAPELVYEVK
jgi:hypothetical protein